MGRQAPFYGKLRQDSYHFLEQAGELTQASGIYVIGVPVDTAAEDLDPQGDALTHFSIPQPGSALNGDNPDVKVIEREPTLLGITEEGVASVEVLITWELQKATANYSIRGGADVESVSTSYDSPDPDTRDVVEVTHDGDSQTGTIQVYEPTNFFEVEQVQTVEDPESDVVNPWIGQLNSHEWRGGSARQWIVWSIRYELLEILANNQARYRFLWQFRRSRVGWDPDVHYENKDGTTPADLVADEGIKTIEYYPSRNFSTKFTGLPSGG